MERDVNNPTVTNYYDEQMQIKERPEMIANTTIQLTSEELQILKECQYNSIVQRGLPLGAASVAGFYYLKKIGIMKPTKTAITIGGVIGFLLGTISYRQICIDKLMALPNSSLKERILNAQQKQPHVRVEVQPPYSQSPSWFDNATPTEQAPMTSSLDIEPYNQSHNFDDLSTKPINADTSYAIDPPLQTIAGTPYTTYDDLRRSNREQYEKSRYDGFRTPDRMGTMGRQPIDPRSSPYDKVNDPTSQPPTSGNFWP